MDGNVFGLVLLLLLLGGNGVDSFVRHRQRNTDREADKARWAALAEELREMKNSLDREYLLREPHMKEHATLDDKLRSPIAWTSMTSSSPRSLHGAGVNEHAARHSRIRGCPA